MAAKAAEADETYSEDKDKNIDRDEDSRELVRSSLFEKGQSKRIWAELYKVIDSSDVIVQVLDARDPMGTRCHHIEKHLKENAKHKHLIFVLNKCDLVPTWVTKKVGCWVGVVYLIVGVCMCVCVCVCVCRLMFVE
jgi:nuclear GTP-binding protein